MATSLDAMTVLSTPLSFMIFGGFSAGAQIFAGQPELSPVTTIWDVSLSDPALNLENFNPPERRPLVFSDVLVTNTTRQFISKVAPDAELPSIAGMIDMTIQVVGTPYSHDPSPSPISPPSETSTAPVPIQVLLGEKLPTEIVFLSAKVYDHSRSYIEIYPSGGVDQFVSAWSNVDFMVFSGLSSYRIRNDDGTVREVCLITSVSNIESAAPHALAGDSGLAYAPPSVPALPELSAGGPAFQILEGSMDSSSLDTIEQLHALYKKEEARLRVGYTERKRKEAERKAALMGDPPKPANVTIRYWKGTANIEGSEEAV